MHLQKKACFQLSDDAFSENQLGFKIIYLLYLA